MCSLLELISKRVCEFIPERASIPIIRLGSAPYAHGQLLVLRDTFGLYLRFKPRLAKRYAGAGRLILNGLRWSVALRKEDRCYAS